jgi:GT2 family glycosyltransferase
VTGEPTAAEKNTGEERIAFVTVLFNCEKHHPLFFECMGRQRDENFVIFVIDNASKDASLATARSLARANNVPCEFIANDENLGIAVGNNQGIERALGRGIGHIVLINNDIGCDDNLVANIRERAIANHCEAWTCLAYLGDTEERWYGGGTLNYWLARGIHFGQLRSARITKPIAVSYAPTCLMYISAGVFGRVGLMDKQYFVYYDDTDFCKRMLDAGIVLTYDPGVSFRHYVGGSSGGSLSDFSLRINTRNKFLYIRKHYAHPMRWIIESIALASKLLQLTIARRRRATWLGLRDAFAPR